MTSLALALEGDSQLAGFGFSANNRAILAWQLALAFTDNRMIGFTNFAVNSSVIEGQAPDITLRGSAVDAWYDTRKGNSCLFLYAGTNDLYFGLHSGGAGIGSNTFDKLTDYCATRKAACPGLKIVVATCLSRSNAGTPAGYNVQRAALNALIRAGHSSFDAVADFAANAFIGYDGAETDTNYFQPDLVHLGAGGHVICGPIAKVAIFAVFPS
jgi:hypothetical protein